MRPLKFETPCSCGSFKVTVIKEGAKVREVFCTDCTRPARAWVEVPVREAWRLAET